MLTSIKTFVNGLIMEEAVADSEMPETAVRKAINVNFDRMGAVQGRKGMTAINGQVVAAKPCLGMHNALFNTAAYNQLLVVFSDGTNNDVYKKDGASWTKVLEDDTKDLKTRFITFLDRVIRLNGTQTAQAWDGNAGAWSQYSGTSAGDLNLDDIDSYKGTIMESFKLRLYMIGDANKPDRMYFSKIVDTNRYITWAPTKDWVDINPNDGDNLTGLKRFGLNLLIFKKNFLYRYKGIANMDPEPLIPVGTHSNESIVSTKSGVFFHHPSGIYLYNGGFPQEVSLPISPFINGISYVNYPNIVSWSDSDHVYFSVGDVTVGGVAFTNIVLRRTLSSQVWTIYSMGSEIKKACSYNSGSIIERVVGDDNGYILQWDTGTTDNGSPINYRLMTKWYELGSLSNTFAIRKLAALCDKAQASVISCQVDSEDTKVIPIGQLKKYLNIFEQEIKGHRVRFILSGSSRVEPFIFNGIEILEGLDMGVIE